MYLRGFPYIGNSPLTGDGTSGLLGTGMQLVLGDRPTSAIPTTTAQVTRAADTSTSAQVTRAADIGPMTGDNFSSWYRRDEGTMYGEIAVLGLSTTVSTAMQLRASSEGNQATLRFSSAVAGVDYLVQSGGVTSADSTSFAVSNNIFGKYAYTYKADYFAVTKDATTLFIDTSGAVPIGVSEFRIASNGFCGYIRKLAFYPKRLSNTELIGITS
jgi:hypothetical protein